MLERRLRQRYSRQTILPVIGEEGQVKLLNSKAVVIGCGALGSHIAMLLARAGVGKITIIDRDFIEIHNLQRQVLFNEEDIKAGLPKAVAAARHLRKINSTIEIEEIVADVNFSNIEKLCSEANVILDGLDNAETRFLINDVSLKLGIPWVYGGAIATTGMTMTIIPGQTPCLRCINPNAPDPGTTPTCETAGILGTVPAIIASIQVTEAMKLLINPAEINRELIIVDVWQGVFDKLKLERREGCPACGGKYEYLEDRFDIRTNSLCGQSRAVQVVNTTIKNIDLGELAARLRSAGPVTYNEYMLNFSIDDKEIVVFPDGRAIVKGSLDENEAKEIYFKVMNNEL